MAILTGVPGLFVSVSADHRDLLEYDEDEFQGPRTTTTKYIEAVSGAEFGVSVYIDPVVYRSDEDGIAVYVNVDGHEANNGFFATKNCNKNEIIRGFVKDLNRPGQGRWPMIFSKLELGINGFLATPPSSPRHCC